MRRHTVRLHWWPRSTPRRQSTYACDTTRSWNPLRGRLAQAAQALEHEQEQDGSQSQHEEEKIFGHRLPPPVEELGIEQDDEQGDTGVHGIRPAPPDSNPDRRGAAGEADNLIQHLD